MERVEKVLLLAVLGVALMIVAVMSFLPEGVKADTRDTSPTQDPPAGLAPETSKGLPEAGGKTLADLMGPTAPKEEPTPQETAKKITETPPVLEDAGGGAATVKNAPGQKAAAQPSEPEPAAQPDSDKARVAMEYVLNPDYLQYVVKQGDTLGQILDEVCGGQEALDDILAVNEQLKLNPHLIRPGSALLIPKFAIRPKSRRKPRATKPTPVSERIVEGPAKEAARELYTVQAGDSLWKIASRRVGNKNASAYVARIQEINPQARGMIRPGMKLRLPR